MNHKLSLLDLLAQSVGCICLSDLRNLGSKDRIRLISKLEEIQPNDYSPQIWNDALNYLVKEKPQPTEAQAKALLLERLLE